MTAGRGDPAASPVTAYIGLGANLGPERQTLAEAAQALRDTAGITALRLSPFYRSAPVGCEGPDYVNAVAEIQTVLSPSSLLAALQRIEAHHGRTRPYRNAPRTLDLDLLWYDGRQVHQPGLTIPHPRMHERAFVLRPLADLAPALTLEQGTLAALLARCADQEIHPLEAAPEAVVPPMRLVVAYTQNRVIGRDGGMPWHLPGDLAHFKRSTLGHPIIMGRRTWRSLGRPLPGRRNLVLSRDPAFRAAGAECYTTLADALAHCQDADRVCIIGGEQLFRQALPLADEIFATEIHAHLDGDTYFPPLPAGHWQEAERRAQAPEQGLRYDFVIYRRIRRSPARQPESHTPRSADTHS